MIPKAFVSWFIICLSGVVVVVSCERKPEIGPHTVAVVGKKAIPVERFRERYESFMMDTGIEDNLKTRREILDNMINENLLQYYDDNTSVENDPEYQKERRWNKKQMVLAYLEDKEIYANITASEREIREAFLRLNQVVEARHLYAPTRAKAESLYRRLQKGATFDALAKEVFTDSKLRNNGGYLGQFTWGDMDPAFEEVAYALDIGRISKPVKTAQGYSIIKVEDRKTQPIITESEFQRKRSKLKRAVKVNKKNRAERAFMDRIFSEKDLSFNQRGLEACLKLWLTETRVENIGESDEAADKDLTCAQYQDQTWSVERVLRALNEVPQFHGEKIRSIPTLKAAIEGFIKQQLLLDLAYQKGYHEAAEVQSKLKIANKNTFLRYKRQAIAQEKSIPDSALKTFYEAHIHQFTAEPQLSIQEVIVERRPVALDLMKRLNKGEDFAAIASKHSQRKWSAENNGKIGYAPLSRFGNLQDTLWNTPVGQIVGPLRFDRYYGVFKILGKREGEPYPFEEIREYVDQTMRRTKERQYVQDYVDSLRTTVHIAINDSLIRQVRLSYP